jgi:hypothetical protein
MLIAIKIKEIISGDLKLIEASISISICAIILPDNYTVLIAVCILFLIFIIKHIREKEYIELIKQIKRYNILIAIVFIYLLMNVLLNKVPIQNIFLHLLYWLVFIILLIVYTSKYSVLAEEVGKSINFIIAIQMIYILVFVIFRFSFIKNQLIGDWSVGTLGTSEGPVLFIIYILAFIKYLAQFQKEKDVYFAVFAGLCFIAAISTVSISLTVLFVISFIIYTLLFAKNIKSKIAMLIVAILMISVFWTFSDPWIKYDLYNTVSDYQYRNKYFKKMQNYQDTFINIPKQDLKFLLVGNGIGNYSSRAALTASGYYVGWFNNEKLVNISYYTKKYINPKIYSVYGVSLRDSPASQYISLMGENGAIVFVLMLFYFCRLLRKNKNANRLTIIFMMSIFFMDNYLEYYKIVLMVFSCYFYINYLDKYKSHGSVYKS